MVICGSPPTKVAKGRYHTGIMDNSRCAAGLSQSWLRARTHPMFARSGCLARIVLASGRSCYRRNYHPSASTLHIRSHQSDWHIKPKRSAHRRPVYIVRYIDLELSFIYPSRSEAHLINTGD